MNEVKIKNYNDKRIALIVLEKLRVTIEDKNIRFETYCNVQNKMVEILHELERFQKTNDLKLISINNL